MYLLIHIYIYIYKYIHFLHLATFLEVSVGSVVKLTTSLTPDTHSHIPLTYLTSPLTYL